ncbi:dipeptide/oligopeptide/nickel ABC transporter ATP-binding protein [Anaeromusa sp.]|uniref:ABC transporter ATP-binding protein n=1 Tax=Anaeromusa sp. TaxID=1872520 RepID=UPI00263301AD|nr:dipeptide/oligopeptide/nickel ABC transporter ATP-binding protein [Anaeromusa sp.]MDD3158028.1 dipeptide/oligopeptide/nickel ABC transporter ATP-binding protein [Anaeromusa sp.]
MEPVLLVSEVQKTFNGKNGKKPVLQNISFSVMQGECVGVVGQSGSGKSTLAKIIAGLLPADGGRVALGGRQVLYGDDSSLRYAYQHLQMVFQQPYDSFNPRKTLGWSLQEGLKNRGLKSKVAEEETTKFLQLVGLNESFKARYPHEISGGECQRAAIARALAMQPIFLICDEITSALDASIQLQIIELLQSLCTKLCIACLFISHDLSLIKRLSQKIVVLHDGAIVETGMTAKVLQKPKSRWTQELLKAEEFFNKTVQV